MFIFSTPVLIRHLWQFKTVVFLHWCVMGAVLLTNSQTYKRCSILFQRTFTRLTPAIFEWVHNALTMCWVVGYCWWSYESHYQIHRSLYTYTSNPSSITLMYEQSPHRKFDKTLCFSLLSRLVSVEVHLFNEQSKHSEFASIKFFPILQ